MQDEEQEEKKELEWIDYTMVSEITCPWCGAEITDSWEAEDDGHIICDSCGGEYSYNREVETTYSSRKVKEPPKE